MTTLAGALFYLVLKLGPNGGLIYDQLAHRDRIDRHFLPIEALYEISREPIYLVFHEERSWQKAFYLPASSPALPAPRSLPGLAVPRLYLYRPYYAVGGRLVELENLAVDTASAYYGALLERQFERKLAKKAFAARATQRASKLYQEVPKEQRLEVYGRTLAEFAGHLMSIASEIARAKRRGIVVCAPAASLPLLEHWRRAFSNPGFVGTWSQEGSFEPILTQNALTSEDKTLAILELLQRPRWKGDPHADLDVCAP